MVLILSSSSCERRIPGPKVKIYVSKPARGGLFRAQDNELIDYSESENYRAMSKPHFDALINWCLNPSEVIKSKRKRAKFLNNINLLIGN